MALQETGPISLQDIHAEFGGPTPIVLSNYYRGGSYVPNTPPNDSVPTSGTIKLTDFYGASNAPYATGGTVNTSGGYRIHTFTTSNNLVVENGGEMEYLIVAGGAGAPGTDNTRDGGAGGGEVLQGITVVSTSTHAITVGDGGTAASPNGQSSAALGISASGGKENDGQTGGESGSGNPGGGHISGTGGGGGGDSEAGTDGGWCGDLCGGHGGDGTYIDWADTLGYGSPAGWFGGGGGGSANSFDDSDRPKGDGGLGGGGDGYGSGTYAQDGVVNTGGGGGGQRPDDNAGGDGGSGIVIVRYELAKTKVGGPTNWQWDYISGEVPVGDPTNWNWQAPSNPGEKMQGEATSWSWN